MPDAIFVEGGAIVPGDALELKFIRSSGPGGQNVNKVASKVQIRVDLDRIQGIDAAGRQRLRHTVSKRLDSSGRLLVTSSRRRDQFQNLQDARKKIHDWIAQALKPPKKRVAARLNETARERRLEEKHRRSQAKAGRRRVEPQSEDDV